MWEKTDRVTEEVYLGFIIFHDGSTTSNVKSRVSKGMGQVNVIMTMLQTVSFGEKYFDIALTLREAMLHKILDAQVPAAQKVFLELGVIPIIILLKGRRIITTLQI